MSGERVIVVVISGRFFLSSPSSPLRWNGRSSGGGTRMEVVEGLAGDKKPCDGIEGLHEENVQAVGEKRVRHFEDGAFGSGGGGGVLCVSVE